MDTPWVDRTDSRNSQTQFIWSVAIQPGQLNIDTSWLAGKRKKTGNVSNSISEAKCKGEKLVLTLELVLVVLPGVEAIAVHVDRIEIQVGSTHVLVVSLLEEADVLHPVYLGVH